MTRIDWAISEIVGKTISGVVVKCDDGESWQVFLVFEDGTYYELFGEGYASSCSSIDEGGIEEVRQYLAGSRKIELEAPSDDQRLGGGP